MLSKIFILAVFVSIGALAVPVLEKNSTWKTTSLPEHSGHSSFEDIAGSSHPSVTASYHNSFLATGRIPGLYVYQPSTESVPIPKNQRKYLEPFRYYEQYVDHDQYPPHECNWQKRFTSEDWEHMYAKCYDGLRAIGSDGSMAEKLLIKYGCQGMAWTLLKDDIRYEKSVARALMKRQDEDHEELQ